MEIIEHHMDDSGFLSSSGLKLHLIDKIDDAALMDGSFEKLENSQSFSREVTKQNSFSRFVSKQFSEISSFSRKNSKDESNLARQDSRDKNGRFFRSKSKDLSKHQSDESDGGKISRRASDATGKLSRRASDASAEKLSRRASDASAGKLSRRISDVSEAAPEPLSRMSSVMSDAPSETDSILTSADPDRCVDLAHYAELLGPEDEPLKPKTQLEIQKWISAELAKERSFDSVLEGPGLEDGRKETQGLVEKTKLIHSKEKNLLKQRSYFTDTVDQPMRYTPTKLAMQFVKMENVPFRVEDPTLSAAVRGHNAIRTHYNNMLEMLNYLRQQPTYVSSADVGQYVMWWNNFASFLSTSFEAEQVVFLQTLSKLGSLPEGVNIHTRRSVGNDLEMYLQNGYKVARNAVNRPPFEPIQRMVQYVPLLNSYLQYAEDFDREVPILLRENVSEQELYTMEKKYIRRLLSNGNEKDIHLHMLFEEMDSTETTYVKKRLLSVTQKLNASTYQKKYLDTHLKCVRYFQKKKDVARKSQAL